MLNILEAGIRVEDRRTVAGDHDNTNLPACITKLHCPKCDEEYVIITLQEYAQDYTATCLKCRGLESSHQAYVSLQKGVIKAYKESTEVLHKEKENYRMKYTRLHKIVGTLINGTRDLEDESNWDGCEYLPEVRRAIENQFAKFGDRLAEIDARLNSTMEDYRKGCPQCSGPLRFSMLDGIGAFTCECGFAVDLPTWMTKRRNEP